MLPYILTRLKDKISEITAVEKIFLFGSRGRLPLERCKELEGKDWDVVVQAKCKLKNARVLLEDGYHLDLLVLDKKQTKKFTEKMKTRSPKSPDFGVFIFITTLEAVQQAKEGEAKEKQGNFYRYMEADVLKHNCIAYLLQDYLNVLGQDFTDGDTMDTFQVYLNENLDKYTALAKFMEQALEWEIMDYTFYPYYWANRKEWQNMYISESVDPLFRSFLQAGIARNLTKWFGEANGSNRKT